ncbi:enoyl-CoA hydratase-related protein [Microvirga flavescens]|uniref:enoyl-CoA hydratase-related protein n=1 Tax=Microvirga flavescens TaxID=2249811 RepID=UPI000DDBA559|nr:enoyl-CoA hydratase-related protein [Microvirga flavescens]
MSAGLLKERDGGVLRLTINRPERRNALDSATYRALAEALREAQGDLGISAVVLTGAGEHFTAGNDLRDFQNASGENGGDLPPIAFLRALNALDVPVVAAVEGHAVGIGVTLLQHCDFAFAGATANFRLPFVALGLCPEGASSLLLPRLAGARKAAQWLLQGKPFDAAEALEAGLLTAVTEPGAALAAALATAADLCAQPPSALRLSKSMLKRAERAEIEATFDFESEQFLNRLKTEEAQAAFARFFASRGG